jgi:phosphatidylinositol alpha-mannosyltransferase
MKVGIVCPYDWGTPGGVKTHIWGLAGALDRNGIETEILAPSNSQEKDIYRLGSTVSIPANGSIARICFSNRARTRIRERLGRGDIDLLHLHEPLIPSTSMLALLTSEIPSVATFHASAPRSFGYAVAKRLLARMARRLEERIVVSPSARNLISKYFEGNFHVIPNGVEYARYSVGKPKEVLESIKPFVLFLGRAESRKGYPVLIDAMKILRAEHDIGLVVAGPSRPDFLPPWAHYIGTVSEEDKPNVYASADLYCAPSLGGESFGVVLLEAMAAGVPVVCSDLHAYVEAAGGAAVHARVAEPADFAEKLALVLTDRRLQSELREKGRERAKQFDWDLLSERVREVYEAALS